MTARDLPIGSIIATDRKAWIKRYDRIDGPYWIGTGAWEVQTTDTVMDGELSDGAKIVRVGDGTQAEETR